MDGMTEQERQTRQAAISRLREAAEERDELKKRQKVMKRLKSTAPGETICLTHEDVTVILKYIEGQW